MCYCYILLGSKTGMLKVGISINMGKRMIAYRSHCSEDLSIVFLGAVADVESARLWEWDVLDCYKDHIHHGEWLNAGAAVIDEISKGEVSGLTSGSPPVKYESRRSHRLLRDAARGLYLDIETVERIREKMIRTRRTKSRHTTPTTHEEPAQTATSTPAPRLAPLAFRGNRIPRRSPDPLRSPKPKAVSNRGGSRKGAGRPKAYPRCTCGKHTLDRAIRLRLACRLGEW